MLQALFTPGMDREHFFFPMSSPTKRECNGYLPMGNSGSKAVLSSYARDHASFSPFSWSLVLNRAEEHNCVGQRQRDLGAPVMIQMRTKWEKMNDVALKPENDRDILKSLQGQEDRV
jgi:hypothetical protein